MAAGGGRSTSTISDTRENWPSANFRSDERPFSNSNGIDGDGHGRLRINTSVGNLSSGQGQERGDDEDSLSATSSVASDVSSALGSAVEGAEGREEVWEGDVSAVVGLQKRGLRGLMEGRRLRERGASVGSGATGGSGGPGGIGGRIGLGIGTG